ncbi:hypothetical protein [Paenibacillus crassostreae]|uniref:Uncharacterized protein n=1 Tax=Paenibacillus crassostreae TaxID=1763538 RepID=A0A167D635_9BACL|nr:hypothetical protein [Paenibacillus crassostreae]AOZ91782.1 hypothetical protein LPB68_05790 [Paenibacillus crassostreae]OAB73986.1 hypothetical protein PNBC_13150 [Paenibacillus crassostreae]
MEEIVYSKAISMNVTTYQILNDKGEQLVSLLQQFFDQFLSYIHEDLEIHIDTPPIYCLEKFPHLLVLLFHSTRTSHQ